MPKQQTGGVRFLRAVQTVSVTGANPAALATAVNAWIAANAKDNTFVQIDYLYDGTDFIAFLTYTG